jgi:hypothetical protein
VAHKANSVALVQGQAKGPVSTRTAVNVIGGVILATALAVLGFGREASSAPCPATSVKCFGTCCAAGQVCVNKGAGASCQCPTGTFLCNGECVSSSDDNCGFCGNTCPDGTTCVSGTCQCPAGTILCGGQCVSTDCADGEQFNFSTCMCEAVQNCTANGGLCTSKNECCSPTAKCSPAGGGRTVCHD